MAASRRWLGHSTAPTHLGFCSLPGAQDPKGLRMWTEGWSHPQTDFPWRIVKSFELMAEHGNMYLSQAQMPPAASLTLNVPFPRAT